MVTTIAVQEETAFMLKQLRDEMDAKSFDETIRKLVQKMKQPKVSLYGALKGVDDEFVREELDRFD